jgi:hypothetical protein
MDLDVSSLDAGRFGITSRISRFGLDLGIESFETNLALITALGLTLS